jgi:hypothetical protein
MDRRWHILLFLFALAIPFGLTALLRGWEPPRFVPEVRTTPSSQSASQGPSRVAAMRQAASAASPAPAFSSVDERHLLELARTGEACALLESPLSARAPLLSLYRILPGPDAGSIPSSALEAYLAAFSSGTVGGFHVAVRSASHPLLDLTEAEAELGLLPGVHVARDPRAAIQLLRPLADSDALNAVPSLFLAYALKLVNEPDEASAELERAYTRPLFRTYAEEAFQSLYLRAQDKPAPLSAAFALGARLTGPDLWPVEDLVLESLADADPRVAEQAYTFGRRLESAENAPSASAAFTAAVNFGFGQRIASAAWRRSHPSQPAPRAIADRPLPPSKRQTLLGGLSLPLPQGACALALPRIARALRAERDEPNRKPALQ